MRRAAPGAALLLLLALGDPVPAAAATFVADTTIPALAAPDSLPRKPLFGASLAPAPDSLRVRLGLAAGEGAILLSQVTPASTAAEGGLRAGDVLLAVDGRPVGALPELVATLRALAVGQRFTVALARDGRRETVTLTMRERPRDRGANYVTHYDHVTLADGARIRTIVTQPTAAPGTRHPVLFLIGGIGAYSMDGALEAVPYGEILRAFADDGWVTVRIDKPGVGDSEGPAFLDVDFDATLAAFRAAYAALPRYAFVDTARVVVFGHSMGGAWAPLVVADRPAGAPRPMGVVAVATTARSWSEYWLENVRRQMTLAGQPAGMVHEAIAAIEPLSYHLVVEGTSPDSLRARHPALAAKLPMMSPDGRTISGQSFRFWHQLAARNLPAAWSRVEAPVLTMHGDADFVAPRVDHQLIADAVNALRPGTATFRALPNTDHGFLTAASERESLQRMKSGAAKAAFNPAVLAELRRWIATVDPSADR